MPSTSWHQGFGKVKGNREGEGRQKKFNLFSFYILTHLAT